eukprot:2083579-Rhodomonas_salina.1
MLTDLGQCWTEPGCVQSGDPTGRTIGIGSHTQSVLQARRTLRRGVNARYWHRGLTNLRSGGVGGGGGRR